MYQLSLVCSCNTKECKYSMSVILRHMTTQIIKKIIFLLNEYLFEWILVGNLLLPLFIYFATVD